MALIEPGVEALHDSVRQALGSLEGGIDDTRLNAFLAYRLVASKVSKIPYGSSRALVNDF